MTKTNTDHEIQKPNVVSREEWLKARLELLNDEKKLTLLSDEVAGKREQLLWGRIDNEYTFDTTNGNVSLADLFEGRSQLLVYHFMLARTFRLDARRALRLQTASMELLSI